MVEALQLSAQLTHLQEVDMTRIAELRKQSKPQFQAKHGGEPDVPAILREGRGGGFGQPSERECVV